MKPGQPLLISAGIVGALLLFTILTILFIPTREILAVITSGLERQGYTMRAGHFGKAFPIGVQARNLEISDPRGGLIRLDKVSFRVSLPPLCLGRVVINYRGEIGKGTIEGDFSPQKRRSFSLRMADVALGDIPFFRTVTEAEVKGALNASAIIQGKEGNYRGELRLWVKGAVLRGIKLSGMPLPDASYETIQGICRVNGGKVSLESFTLQGKGLYVRLKGDMPVASPPGSAPLNMTFELMPKPEFLEGQKFIFILLSKYLSSPGHYQIPIRGTLAKPAIQ